MSTAILRDKGGLMSKLQKVILVILAILDVVVIGGLGFTVYNHTTKVTVQNAIVGIWQGVDADKSYLFLDFARDGQVRILLPDDEDKLTGVYMIGSKRAVQLEANAGEFLAHVSLDPEGTLTVSARDSEWTLEKVRPIPDLAERLIGLWVQDDGQYAFEITEDFILFGFAPLIDYELWGNVLVSEIEGEIELTLPVVSIQGDSLVLGGDIFQPSITMTRKRDPLTLPQDILGEWISEEDEIFKFTEAGKAIIDDETYDYEVLSAHSIRLRPWEESQDIAMTFVDTASNELVFGVGGKLYALYRDPLDLLLADSETVLTPSLALPSASRLVGAWRLENSDVMPRYLDFMERGIVVMPNALGVYTVSEDGILSIRATDEVTMQISELSEDTLHLQGMGVGVHYSRLKRYPNLKDDIMGVWLIAEEGIFVEFTEDKMLLLDTPDYMTYTVVNDRNLLFNSDDDYYQIWPVTHASSRTLTIDLGYEEGPHNFLKLEEFPNLAEYLVGVWLTEDDGIFEFTETGEFKVPMSEDVFPYQIVDGKILRIMMDEEVHFLPLVKSPNEVILYVQETGDIMLLRKVQAHPNLADYIIGRWVVDDDYVLEFTETGQVISDADILTYQVVDGKTINIRAENDEMFSFLVLAVSPDLAWLYSPEMADVMPLTRFKEQPDLEATLPDEKFKVAFVYVNPPGDLGWTYEHEQGRLMLEEELGDRVEITYEEYVPEGPESAHFIREFAQRGYDMIFATSFGYMDAMVEVANEFPDIYFEHCSGYKTSNNLSTYFGRMYQPRYLSGIVAGKMTQQNKIGYVAAFPIPEIIRGINAFALGVRAVNPEATVHVVWSEAWYDPLKETEAAVALLDEGIDIIAQHQDTTQPQIVARKRGALSIGYGSDMRPLVGDIVLTSPVWNWGAYYVDTVQRAIDGEWEPHQFWGGMNENVVALADYSPEVPQDVRDLVAEAEQKILAGEDVFCGPINQQDGSRLVAAGQCMSDDDMLGMDIFVEGVVGTIPEP